MADEACRTRSQKRALEKEVTQNDIVSKKLKLETGLLDGDLTMKAEPGSDKMPGLLKSGEVKATIKVEVPTGEEPMDMSTSKSDVKREKRAPSPDVIVLSDNEPSSPRMNGLTKQAKEPNSETFLLIQRSSPEERERLIKQLKEELRLEEAKLVLLKKLRQSQIQKETAPQKVPSRIGGTVIPPPLVRGGQQAPAKQSTQIVMPPLVRGAQPISVSPQQMHNIRQHPSTGPPPLLLAPRASVPSVQMQGQRIIQQGLIRVANVANTSLLVNIPQASPTSLKGSAGTTGNATSISSGNANESPASRQAAAKLALRKQLEKTLLEIPPPKPPAPELNFLPSAANNEFIYLVGLEEVVQNLLETQGKTVPPPASHEPYSCAQCKTDFTSRWRQEKNGTIMCDVCMTSNQKKTLKAEHTNRLKAAFVKALQQEQEIEQRILQSSSPAQIKSEHSVQHHSLKQSPTPISRGLSGTTRGVLHTFPPTTKLPNAGTLANRSVKHGEHHVNKTNLATGNWKKSINAGQTSSQRVIATQQSKKQSVEMHRGGTLTFVNPGLTVHKSAAVDRQREYLLDMIPSRSITQSSTWK
ncbi:transcriptional repressor p66-alpha [Hyla sarda]|uniref:transcriptional repressor p66-alpha n=1 Tax=Hyla sarda TaxID=327740 RepID=UPI0024C3D559|nr:transcriptional repressor p66-alpha [Hyla sarda]XP_056374188.1 transcriptional repressor p66-alpha [Hyla sarda]XP_056374189.1 transcriptional repressor p66-alpha [Hyla sarda]XP_056374190.1 transcriptional repressor p66-alpha [Hyla sarda]XP_056374191.1 transcriptional repressor p66-alpha [Hyla sarda]